MADKRQATRAQAEQAVQQMLDAGLPESEIRAAMADVVIDGQDTKSVSRPQSWWDRHPQTREVVKGALATLPVVGGTAGAMLASPGIFTSAAGAGLGMGVGRGAEDLAKQALGLEQTSPGQKARRIAGDVALGTALPVGEAAIVAPRDTLRAGIRPLVKGAQAIGKTIAEEVGPGAADVAGVVSPRLGNAIRTAQRIGQASKSPLVESTATTTEPITGMPKGVRIQPEQPSIVDPRVAPSDAELASARGRTYAAGRKPTYRDVPPLATTPEGAMPKEAFQQLRESVLREFSPSERVAAKRIMDEEIDLMPLLDRGPSNAQARAAERFGRIYRSETGEISPETAIGTVVAGAGGAYAAKKLYDFVREKLSEANKQMNPFQIYADKLKGQ